jgi:hypothetical protein
LLPGKENDIGETGSALLQNAAEYIPRRRPKQSISRPCKRHPKDMGAEEIRAFLAYLVTERNTELECV